MKALRVSATLILSFVCFSVLLAEAQPVAKVPRVGILTSTPPVASDPFGEGLRALGWVEGQNVVIERRYTQGDNDRASGKPPSVTPNDQGNRRAALTFAK